MVKQKKRMALSVGVARNLYTVASYVKVIAVRLFYYGTSSQINTLGNGR